MIKAKLYFDRDTNPSVLVETLKTLPELIQPAYFAEDEGKIIKANRLDDNERFLAFLKKNPAGFFLYAENRTCIDFTATSGSGNNYSDVTLWLANGLSSELAATFLKCVAEHKPVFGFACYDPERVPDASGGYVISHDGVCSEYDHRNTHFITLGKNNIESGIGRKLDKYIPGVYWLTLLSDGLLAEHGVKLTDLAADAISTETLGDDSLHLLRFFENPEDWKDNADRLDNLCERVEGVFSRRAVEAAVVGVTNFLEYDDIIANWR
ncbi:MAG: hypothetical protein R2684_12105 [Pyrinomonadaceae bacterium]